MLIYEPHIAVSSLDLTTEVKCLLGPVPIPLPIIRHGGANALCDIIAVPLVGAHLHFSLHLVRAMLVDEPTGRVKIAKVVRYDKLQNLRP